MNKEKFEYASGQKEIGTSSRGPLDVSKKNGLECIWNGKIDNDCVGEADVLVFAWKFNWDELKKRGIDRLSGYIHVKPSLKTHSCRNRGCEYSSDDDDDEVYSDMFSSRKLNVDLNLKKPNQVFRCKIDGDEGVDYYLGMFEYSLIPHYAKIEEVKKDASSVQNDTSSIKKKENSIANEKVSSDKIVSTTEQNDGIPVEEGEKKAHVNEENLSSDSDEMFSPSEQKDAVLVVDGKKVHVNKWFLSYHSEFFRNLFIMDCKDGKPKEIPIGGISYEDFKLLLGPIYSKPVFPTDQTVEKLLELATRFKMSSVIDHCEHHLLHMSKLGNEKKESIFEQYEMSKLLHE